MIEIIQDIEITSLSSTGEGIGAHHGLKIFVEGALPGERVSIQITQVKKNYALGRLISIQKSIEKRVEPPCPLFGKCGGCQIMHLDYSAQLELKQKKVQDALKRIGGFSHCDVAACIASPLPLQYRNKIQIPIQWENGKITLGLYRKQSHEIIALKRCLIQNTQGEKIIAMIKERLRESAVKHLLIRDAVFNQESLVVLVTNGKASSNLKKFAQELIEANPTIKGIFENVNKRVDNIILGPRFHLLAGAPFITEQLLGLNFKISPGAFFQVNSGQAEKIYEYAIDLAEIQPHHRVLDAYCGVGTLALFAAKRTKEVFGIESVSAAIEDAKENAKLNGLKHATFICGKAEESIQKFKNLDVVFLNPPRKGCEPEILSQLLESQAQKLIYISCEPATLARDLKILSEAYQIQSIQPFDMFPQTMHVETVVSLTPVSLC